MTQNSPSSPRRRRVLFVVESGTDSRLAEGLADLFELEVYCRKIEGGVEISQPLRTAVPVELAPASRINFAFRVLGRLVARWKRYDLVIVQGYALASLACNLFGRLSGMPTVMLVCSPVELYYRCRRLSPDTATPYRPLEYFALRFFAWLNGWIGQGYFVLSAHLGSVVRSHGSRLPVEIIPVYGVDCNEFCPGSFDSRVLSLREGSSPNAAIIFFSSRIAPEKDADTLLLAARALRDEGRTILVVNRSGGFRAFARRAEELGVREIVDAGDALNPRKGLADLYRASDVCVQASREEGLGFSPLEALACGRPVVATAVGGLLETIVDGETGWSYPCGDVARLTAAIREVLTNAPEAVRRAARGRTMVLAQYERSKVFADFAAAVNRTLEGRERRRYRTHN